MPKRYAVIWFDHLPADRLVRRHPELKEIPFVLSAPERGRMMVKAVNGKAQQSGIYTGMVLADCRAILPELQVMDYHAEAIQNTLEALAAWCIRYTPIVAVDEPDGLVLDVSGCTHLWGGEQPYLDHLLARLNRSGYQVRGAMADTIAAAWAVTHYGRSGTVVALGEQLQALAALPPAALRLETMITERLEKLGFCQVHQFINLPRTSLRRRFGAGLLTRIDQVLGHAPELLQPVQPIEPYEERLPCFEPIRTAKGIEIAMQQLLSTLCERLKKEDKGLRDVRLICYRIDGAVQEISITTNHPTRNTHHLFKLLELRIGQLEPDLGFELFVLRSQVVEEMPKGQHNLWNERRGSDHTAVAELLDKLAGRIGQDKIHRYIPSEHYLPERSFTITSSLDEPMDTHWRTDLPRPVTLLKKPEPIEVSVPIPDYPPMLFRHKGVLYPIKKADGPERIEQEWWIEKEIFRDYYCVEDEQGKRYWLFRAGHYHEGEPKWYLHGFFA